MNLTSYFRRHGIRRVAAIPETVGGGFVVQLTCGGPSGYGDTAEKALANAKEKNADWIGKAA